MADFIKIAGAILLFLVFIVGGILVISDNIDRGNIENTNDVKNGTQTLQSMEDQLISDLYINTSRDQYDTAVTTGSDSEDVVGGFITRGYKALVKIVNLFKVTNNIITRAGEYIGIPRIFLDIAYTLILITISLSIIYMMFRFQPR